jgi:outer membrane lipoprotein-sorting protein
MEVREKIGACVLLIFSLLMPTSFRSNTPSCKEILQNTVASVEKIQTLKFHLKCNERISGKLLSTESQVKLNRAPRKIYIFLKGPELLWVEGKNNGNCLVNPAGFPFMNLSLDPMGSLMREKQHHTIHQMGFEYFGDIIKSSMTLLSNDFDTYFKCAGSLNWNGRDCYFITAEYPDFKYIDYKVQKGEDFTSIARKLKVSDFMLLEVNKAKNYHDVKVNEIIKVPNVYGKKMILYIDKETFIPRVIKVYDEKGLFESYEYHDLQVNPPIPDEEFTKEYKGYGF